ncbi:MAG TPA: hypothetical protein VKB23_13050 [Solirubrobacterales bacterium]|nr:hypothetical protein [Solirubrobacterales bacterium]
MIGQARETLRQHPAWLLLAGIPAVWLTHLFASFSLTQLACNDGVLEGEVLGMPGVKLAMLALTLLAAAYLALTVTALWRERGEAARFTAFVGTLLAANVGAYLIWMVIPLFVAQTCR